MGKGQRIYSSGGLSLGTHLDIWDVTDGHPRARAELEELVKASERFEKVRKLNPRQFSELYRKNIAGEARFDDLVDAFQFD